MVDLKLSHIKPLHAKWLVALYNHIKSNPDIVKNGRQKFWIACHKHNLMIKNS